MRLDQWKPIKELTEEQKEALVGKAAVFYYRIDLTSVEMQTGSFGKDEDGTFIDMPKDQQYEIGELWTHYATIDEVPT